MTDSSNPSTPISASVAHKKRSDAASVAWALTGVTLFVLAVGVFIIQQVIDTPRSYATTETDLLEEPVEVSKEPAIVVLRPETDDSQSRPKNPAVPLLR